MQNYRCCGYLQVTLGTSGQLGTVSNQSSLSSDNSWVSRDWQAFWAGLFYPKTLSFIVRIVYSQFVKLFR